MFNFINQIGGSLPLRILFTFIGVIILYWIFSYIFNVLKKYLLKRAKNKKERSDIEIFSRAIKYAIILFLIIFGILSYSGSLVSIGLFAGLISASLGWALQRPITGVAAWLMIVVKRPFEIGDRVIIGNVKGDISDITLTHVHIKEIGGTIPSEETSGRLILIPNAKLFEVDIINYTKKDDFILDEVIFPITFDSDIDGAQKIAEESAEIVLKDYEKNAQKPYSRTYFQPSGVNIFVRYLAFAPDRNEISSRITQGIFKKVNQTEKIKFAYLHTEISLSKSQYDSLNRDEDEK
ncbi:mechanosensitive ion channel family protein [Candidatus Atribacteria bacterium MT.SAG.1]|nr:mechanosensitive ion channel family protein [Candidatus Atribacteria bacterium MT.SAG.1]